MKLILVVIVAFAAAGCDAATLDASMVNSSALFGVGNTASFLCNVVGAQALGETLSFSKVDSGVATLISSDLTVVNSTKYSISGTYTLTINDVVWTDEGEYTCALGLAASNTAYLTVGVAPTEGWIYWGNNMTYTNKDEKANLTCEAGSARPPATFRWFKGTTQITTGIINPTSTVDASGYGTSKSMMEMTPSSSDEGVEYTCYIDAAGKEGVFNKTLAVSFSAAGNVIASVCLVLASLVMSVRL